MYIDRLREIEWKESERILLRRFNPEDSIDVYEFARDKATTEYLVWYPHRSQEQSLEVINQLYIPSPGTFAIVLKGEEKCIGCIDLRVDEPNKKASFGYVLNRNYWGKGYMTETLKLILDLSFNVLNLNRVESTHYKGNEGSGAVMKKCGMIYEGTGRDEVYIKERFHDVLHFGITRELYSNQPFNEG